MILVRRRPSPKSLSSKLVVSDARPMDQGKLQGRENFLKILSQAFHGRCKALLVVFDDLFGLLETLLIAPRGESLIDELLEGRSGQVRKLVDDVAHLVHLAALHQRASKLPSDRLAQSYIAVNHTEQRFVQPSPLHILDEGLPTGPALLVSYSQVEQHFTPIPSRRRTERQSLFCPRA